MLDVWVCSSCHSINRERAAKCYKCGSPREAATGEGARLREARAISERVVHSYRSSVEFALVAAFLIVVVAALAIYGTILEAAALPTFNGYIDAVVAGGPLDAAGWEATLHAQDWLDVLTLGAGIVALLAFAGWLSISVSNAPMLGGGVPSVTPLRAFYWGIVPILNLRKVPQILVDLLYRLDARRGGVFTVGLAWAGFGGSWILGRIAGLYLDLRLGDAADQAGSLAEFAASLKTLLQTAFNVDIVLTVFVAFGALMLVAIIVEIERRAAARNREVEAVLDRAR